MNNTGLLFPLLILLLFVPILLSGRRQKRQVAQMQQLQHSLSDGDVVVTTSGLRGTVVDSSYEDTLDLEIAPGVVTTWMRAAVREKVNPPAEDGPTGAPPEPVTGQAPAADEPKPAPAAHGTPAKATDTAPGDPTAPGAAPASDPTSPADTSASDPASGRGGA